MELNVKRNALTTILGWDSAQGYFAVNLNERQMSLYGHIGFACHRTYHLDM